MLRRLSIRNLILIDRVDLEFEPGLSVLTGETGAGKSILLDGLGLALGARSAAGLVSTAASQASITASFELVAEHPAREILRAQDLEIEDEDDLVLRRTVTNDGRSRAFVNDTPASAGILRQLGGTLVQIEGQDDAGGLLDPSSHLALLDGFASHDAQLSALGAAYDAWRRAATETEAFRAALEHDRTEADFLRHATAELEALAPEPDEEDALAAERTRLMAGEKIRDALDAARHEISDDSGVAARLRSAHRSLERVATAAGGALDDTLAALERAAIEAEEAESALTDATHRLESDPARLDRVEQRLFALRGAARKHGIETAALADLLEKLRADLARIEDGTERLSALERDVEAAGADYALRAAAVSETRHKAARRLDKAVARELGPLKLEDARFQTALTATGEDDARRDGMDRCAFMLATSKGAPAGPLGKIASGGERARLALALRVSLARASGLTTLVFDELDRGIGGAVANAVGERLARLATRLQVLVVTHSPQVAAAGGNHFLVTKHAGRDRAETQIERLAGAGRREEIARMLSGATVTAEARAAAASLLRSSGERP